MCVRGVCACAVEGKRDWYNSVLQELYADATNDRFPGQCACVCVRVCERCVCARAGEGKRDWYNIVFQELYADATNDRLPGQCVGVCVRVCVQGRPASAEEVQDRNRDWYRSVCACVRYSCVCGVCEKRTRAAQCHFQTTFRPNTYTNKVYDLGLTVVSTQTKHYKGVINHNIYI